MTRSSYQSSITLRTPNTAANPNVIESCRLDSRHRFLSDQHEYRNAGLSDSRQPSYDNRNHQPTVVCEADKGETYQKEIVESENEANQNRLSDKRNSPPKTHDINTVNDMNNNSKPIQWSEEEPKTKSLLLKKNIPRKS
ncbi:hypothetical protein CHS0354_037648 [Potamilus streckersoni]|uniref:Uncharacterized protein n=1 Tax=Potamilus streckersoni TaxID=2493646 RepID=A0AAE0T7I1_9BIVA|nr:hypothetical protein CHS0354_037648 [Potamilus streckersoni]